MRNVTNFEVSENVAAALILILSSVASMIGNGIVILNYLTYPKLRSQPGCYFIVNLALSDLLSAIYVQIPCIVDLANPGWLFYKKEMCLMYSIFTWAILTASNWTIAAISVDRATAVLKPFQHANWITNFRVRLFIAVIWIFSIIFPAAVIKKESTAFFNWELMCSPRWTKENATAGYLALIFCFGIPTTILFVCNVSIIYAVRNLRKIASHTCPKEANDISINFCVKDNTKTLRSFYVLVIVYLLCISPYFAAKFSFLKKERGMLTPSVFVLTILLMFLASALNPFIYSLLRKDHKEAFLKTAVMLKDKFKKSYQHLNFKKSETIQETL